MEDANNETDLEINYNSEASIGDKRKREGKLRSKVWQHFTKVIREDGKCDKCQCNHCQKLFTCSSRSGTTHLLRHITEGICPVYKKDKEKTVTISSYPRGSMEQRNGILPWKYDQGLGQSSAQQCMDVEVELLPERLSNLEPQSFKTVEDEYGTQTPLPLRCKLPLQPAMKSQPKGEAWMNEFRNCVAKLVELNNGKVPVALQSSAAGVPDYSISAALKGLNEMEDIPQSSEMYLDAFEILQDAGERECFICLPPEPRRRWLQRVLHRRHPSRYSSNM
ncbi:hypothetical protein C2S52_013274 [Perilla frutescens var. hirtella]|uniref:BED-type domain-containing protein n=1 Tax=Perilla frutescens var. hirtella TaxID=608512 RepID=A0AAD4PDX2_PERFH|nr:hypothetical protein C2S51_015585 [Perilla frutescens var. frutescens]KAH6775713.1 hypothetical protein C2S52_013274 [Perilla frutescens var. hirtella]KAH6835706.1 hypothetical protein C2S53_017734 [Perilla frutescens var. hirtella]